MKRVNVLSVLAMLALAPMLLGATVAEKDITTSNDVANTARNAASFVGSWSCEASKAEELPGGQGKLVMTQPTTLAGRRKVPCNPREACPSRFVAYMPSGIPE